MELTGNEVCRENRQIYMFYMFNNQKYEVYSTDYQAVLDIAHERFILVGEIGYYYPACVWIGESGKLYATHEYDGQVFVFQSLPN